MLYKLLCITLLAVSFNTLAMNPRDAWDHAVSTAPRDGHGHLHMECSLGRDGNLHGCKASWSNGNSSSRGNNGNVHDMMGNETGFVMSDGSVCTAAEIRNAQIIMGLKEDDFEGHPINQAIGLTLMSIVNILRNTKLDTGIRMECAREFVEHKCRLIGKSHFCYADPSRDPQWINSPENQQKLNTLFKDPIIRSLAGYR